MTTKTAPVKTGDKTAPAAEKAAEKALTVPTFAAVARPATTRVQKDNPYAPAIKALADDVDETGTSNGAQSVTVPQVEADAHIRLAQKAARALGVTARQQRVDNKDGSAVLTFWTVKAIKRERKDETADAPAAN